MILIYIEREKYTLDIRKKEYLINNTYLQQSLKIKI